MYPTDDRPALPPLVKSGLICLVYVAVVIACAAPVSMWLLTPASAAGTTPFPATASRTAAVAVSTSTPSTTAAPKTTVAPARAGGMPAGAVTPLATTVRPPAPASGCPAALAYVSTHAAPGFQTVCPGYAEGAQALTCFDHAPCAPNQRMIVIADPCPAAYMNEAHNSWVLLHNALGTAIPGGSSAIDPYGYCS
jgi:hypothetical protein